MAIGTVHGYSVSTAELVPNETTVIVDHHLYDVIEVNQAEEQYAVVLAATYGMPWVVWVDSQDYAEPMWELA